MIDALDRLRLLMAGLVAALLMTTLVIVGLRGFDEAGLTGAGPGGAQARPDEDRAAGPSERPTAPGADPGPESVVETGDDLLLVSDETRTSPASDAAPPASHAPRPTDSTPTVPPTTSPPTPVQPPTTPPVTPPTTPRPTPPVTPTPPPAPAPSAAVVDVKVLSGGQVLAVDVNLGAPNLVNLSLLQP